MVSLMPGLNFFLQCQVFKALNENLNTLSLLFFQNADRALTDVSVIEALMMQIVTLCYPVVSLRGPISH